MLKDIVSHMDLYGMAETATMLFLGVFVVVGIITLFRSKGEMEKLAGMPTDELPRV